MEIKNFIPEFPDKNDPNLGKILFGYKEFHDKILEADEAEHTDAGIPYNHQTLQGRFFSPKTLNTSGIIVHGLGAGKTCVGSILVELFKKTFVNGSPRKPALIILKSDHLRESFRAAIGKDCTKAIYTLNLQKEIQELKAQGIVEIDEKILRIRMNAAISEFYEIVTERELFDTRNVRSVDYHKREYSNRVIIIDESHSYREHIPIKSKDESKKEHQASGAAYTALHKFLHNLTNTRVFLLTGTPIWDQHYDFASQMNLILPLDEQLPTLTDFTREFFKDGILKDGPSLEKLKNAMRSRISYIRSKRTDKRIDHGIAKPWLNFTKVYPSVLSEYQRVAIEEAKKFVKASEFDLISTKKKKGGSYFTAARDAANCVYPEIVNKKLTGKAVYGKDIFLKYAAKLIRTKVVVSKTDPKTGEIQRVEKEKNIYEYQFQDNYLLLKKELGPNENDPNGDIYSNLRKYSAKFATIIEMLLDPERITEKAFVYIDSVNGTGGVLSFALILQLYGFRWIKSPSGIRGSSIPSFSTPGGFITITTELGTIKDTSQIREALERYNSDDNVYGQQARIIIASDTISHGHTLKATRQTHIAAGFWNFPSTDQPAGRTYRLGSFKQLPEDQRYANFYLHVGVAECLNGKKCVKISKEDGNTRNKLVLPDETVDIHVYRAAEEKEKYNAQLYRLMKIMSWDCALTYKRNVLDTDTPGSRDCNLTDCDYVCDGFEEEGRAHYTKKKSGPLPRIRYEMDENLIDHSNYNLLYSSHQVARLIEDIRQLFQIHFVLNLRQIYQNLAIQPHEEFVVMISLMKMINEKMDVYDAYGYKTFLRESSNMYYLDNSITKSEYSSAVYEIFPLVSELSTLEDAIETVQLTEDIGKVTKFIEDPTIEKFDVLSYRTKIVLLESTLLLDLTHSNTAVNNPKCSKASSIITSKLQNETYRMTDGCIVHNMYNNKEVGARYAVLTQDLKSNGKLRVLDPDEEPLEWKSVLPSQEEIYISEIKQLIQTSTESGFEENPYDMYGMIDKTNKFKIVRKGNKGAVCGTIPIPEIRELFFRISHLPYDDELNPSITESKLKKAELQGMIEGLSSWRTSNSLWKSRYNDMSPSELKKLYTLFEMSRGQLCASLERWFKGENNDKKVYFKNQ
jgi:hypothetical protein